MTGGISSVPLSFEDPVYIHEVNVTGTFNVFAATIRARVRRVVNASSSSVYGNNGAELQTESAVTGARISLNELASVLNEIFGSQIRSVNEPERPGDIKHSCADTRLSEKFLGDYKVAAFREGLVKTARWFLEVSGRTKRCAEP
jgi:nucleoside-diphosphate-sugar epimerase